ncbi:GL19991 [Drosophila persimilis]|uniref:GL19991 n=1 Tax=Drosophila persimilis TaxID=7234 RepID=B4HD78_DROPE|nr:GL19991 [Drosophila persimilis]
MCSAANDNAMKVAVTPGDDESFIIYHDGEALQLHWKGVPPLTRPPALRICRIGDADRGGVLLLTTDHSLYSAQLQTNRSSLDLTLLRTDVVDVDYCSGSLELFVVLANGSVQRQFITGLGLDRDVHHPHAWQTLSFDPPRDYRRRRPYTSCLLLCPGCGLCERQRRDICDGQLRGGLQGGAAASAHASLRRRKGAAGFGGGK